MPLPRSADAEVKGRLLQGERGYVRDDFSGARISEPARWRARLIYNYVPGPLLIVQIGSTVECEIIEAANLDARSARSWLGISLASTDGSRRNEKKRKGRGKNERNAGRGRKEYGDGPRYELPVDPYPSLRAPVYSFTGCLTAEGTAPRFSLVEREDLPRQIMWVSGDYGFHGICRGVCQLLRLFAESLFSNGGIPLLIGIVIATAMRICEGTSIFSVSTLWKVL